MYNEPFAPFAFAIIILTSFLIYLILVTYKLAHMYNKDSREWCFNAFFFNAFWLLYITIYYRDNNYLRPRLYVLYLILLIVIFNQPIFEYFSMLIGVTYK